MWDCLNVSSLLEGAGAVDNDAVVFQGEGYSKYRKVLLTDGSVLDINYVIPKGTVLKLSDEIYNS